MYHSQLRRLHIIDASDLAREALRRCLEHEHGSGVGFKVIVDKGTVFRFKQGAEGIEFRDQYCFEKPDNRLLSFKEASFKDPVGFFPNKRTSQKRQQIVVGEWVHHARAEPVAYRYPPTVNFRGKCRFVAPSLKNQILGPVVRCSTRLDSAQCVCRHQPRWPRS